MRADEWKEYALCHVTDGSDKTWIEKPDEVTERRLARVCSRCPVIEECYGWVVDSGASGIFAAGEWFDD